MSPLVRTCILSLLGTILISFGTACSSQKSSTSVPLVALTQIIEHPSLDQEREGILSALKDAGFVSGQNIRVIYQNAQGSAVISAQIAQSLVSLNPKVVVAISTPSAQSALASIGNRKIPLVFTAVTDPLGARLIQNNNAPSHSVTGVSDYISSDSQIQLVKAFLPHIKRIGVIYNPGEANSAILYKALKEKAAIQQIELLAATANRTSEVGPAAQSLVGKVEAIYIPNDNTAVSSMSSIAHIGIAHRLPVFAGDVGSVKQGAVASIGYDRFKLGKNAGKSVVQILRGEEIDRIPIQMNHPLEITINPESAEKMGVTIPRQLPVPVHTIHSKGEIK